MLLKYGLVAIIIIVLLATGFNKWKKKYGYKDSCQAGGDSPTETEGSRIPQYPKEEPKPTNNLRKAEQAADRATKVADKVYQSSRSKTKGKTK